MTRIFLDHLLERVDSPLDGVAAWFIHEKTSLQI